MIAVSSACSNADFQHATLTMQPLPRSALLLFASIIHCIQASDWPLFTAAVFVSDAGTPFKADRDLWLSPEARLLADSPGVEDFVYDGQGKRLVLPQDISVDEPLPLILIGPGKTLQLKNLKLVYAASLPACLQLGPGTNTCNKPHNYVYVLMSAISMISGKAAIFIVTHRS